METGRTTALVRAVNWGRLSYVLIGRMVDWDQKKETEQSVGAVMSHFYKHLPFQPVKKWMFSVQH